MDFWSEQQSLYRLFLTVGREPKHRRQTHDLLRSGHAHFLTILQEGAAAGELPPHAVSPQNLSALAWAILDMVRGFNERRMDKIGPATTTPRQDAQAITTITLNHLGLTQNPEPRT
jgi:hypothetical protein